MAKKRKKSKTKVNTKVIYRTKKLPSITPTKEDSSRLKKEISELEESKKQAGTGIRGVFRRMAIQKKISDKSGYFKARDKLATTKKTTELIKVQTEMEEAKNKLKEVRSKRQVNFGDFGKQSNPQQIKELKFEDMFKWIKLEKEKSNYQMEYL